MDSFELNKIIAAILMVALLIIGISKISNVIFYAEKPKTPGYAVEVKQVSAEPEKSFMPEHPQADSDGYVYKAAVNVDQEMVEMMEAGRQYQNNIEVISTIRALMMRTLSLGK